MRAFVKYIYHKVNLWLALRGNVEYQPDLFVGIGSTIRAPDKITIGRRVTVAAYSMIACNGKIGNGVGISSHVGIVGRCDHDLQKLGVYVPDAPWIYSQDAKPRNEKDEIIIEDDAYIGWGAIVLSGIRIGRSSVIAAGAVVVRDVPPYAIVAGNPARQIGERFNKEQQREHESLLLKKYGPPCV